MTQIVDSLADCDVAVRGWLAGAGDILVLQRHDNPDVNDEHFLFHLLGTQRVGISNNEYSNDDDIPHHSFIATHELTYQVDAQPTQYCIDKLNRALAFFNSGAYVAFGNYMNLAFMRSGDVNRLPEWKNTRRHYRSTVDLVFSMKQRYTVEINSIDSVTVGVCQNLRDDIPAITTTRP